MANMKKEYRGLGDNKTEFSTAPAVQEVKCHSEGVGLARRDVRLKNPSLLIQAWVFAALVPVRTGIDMTDRTFRTTSVLRRKLT